MDAHELHGELFTGEGAMDLGIIRVGDNIALTAVVHGGVSGTRVLLPPQAAREAWHHLGELLGFPGAFNAEEMAVLNALVTFAAENVPGGLSEDERAIARKVGSATLRMAGPGL